MEPSHLLHRLPPLSAAFGPFLLFWYEFGVSAEPLKDTPTQEQTV